MNIQERFVQAYDLAEYGIKTKLKDIYGSSTVDYAVGQCRKGLFTKEDVIEEYLTSLKDLTKDEKQYFLEMCNQIQDA